LQEANAEEQRMAARYANDIEIAKSKRDYELKTAAFAQEVSTKTAQSNLAYELQVSLTDSNQVLLFTSTKLTLSSLDEQC
jgi:flotillin